MVVRWPVLRCWDAMWRTSEQEPEVVSASSQEPGLRNPNKALGMLSYVCTKFLLSLTVQGCGFECNSKTFPQVVIKVFFWLAHISEEFKQRPVGCLNELAHITWGLSINVSVAKMIQHSICLCVCVCVCVYINTQTGLYLKIMCTEMFQEVFNDSNICSSLNKSKFCSCR